LFGDMIELLSRVTQSLPSAPDLSQSLHLRLFYVATKCEGPANDGLTIRTLFHSALSVCFGHLAKPATTIVPVHAIRLIEHTQTKSNGQCLIVAIQAIVINPIAADTELWIRHGR
jgi:hypothetical protein